MNYLLFADCKLLLEWVKDKDAKGTRGVKC